MKSATFDRSGSSRHAARRGFINGTGWLVLGLFLIVAIIHVVMNLDRLNNRSIAQLLVIPVTLATVVGLICWHVAKLITKRNTIAGTVGWSTILVLATVTRILIMAGIMTGSTRGGNLRVHAPGAVASNSPNSGSPARNSPAATQPSANQPAPTTPARPTPTPTPTPVMPNRMPAPSAAAPSNPGAAPGSNPFPKPNTNAPTHDFASVADQVAASEPAAREILARHARELQGLVDGFAGPAKDFMAVLNESPTIDTSVLRKRIATVRAMTDAGTRYNTAAKALRERLEADLRAEPRIDKDSVPSISGRFIALSSTTGRTFAIDQVIRAGEDLSRQSQLVLDAPTNWSIDASGRVTSTDLQKAGEYRMYEAKLIGPKRMLQGAVDRAVSP